MKSYAFSCTSCGSANIRRSRQQSLSETAKMLLGDYPFRCFDCGNRFWVNVWRFSILPFAKCPRCLSIRIIDSPRHHSKGLLRRLLLTWGAHSYRCAVCRHDFLSFRRTLDAVENAAHAEAVPEAKT